LTYLLSICLVLVAPSCLLLVRLRSRIRWTAFAIALSAISVIGNGWSAVVTAYQWWTFGSSHVTGWRPLPNLLVEEVIFYPAGGALCILLYLASARRPARPRRGLYVAFLVLVTAFFATLALSHAAERPYYLYSQLLVYNVLVCGTLAPAVSHRIDFRGFAVATEVMAITGYVWDHLAFVRGWWEYHAITQLHLGLVPLDDVDFFLVAPAAAISIYELARAAPLFDVRHRQRRGLVVWRPERSYDGIIARNLLVRAAIVVNHLTSRSAPVRKRSIHVGGSVEKSILWRPQSGRRPS